MAAVAIIAFLMTFFAAMHPESGLNWLFTPRGSRSRKRNLVVVIMLVVAILTSLAWLLDMMRIGYIIKTVDGSTLPGALVSILAPPFDLCFDLLAFFMDHSFLESSLPCLPPWECWYCYTSSKKEKEDLLETLKYLKRIDSRQS